MSGAKNFGVRSPPDPAAIHRPYPLPTINPDASEPPDRSASGSTCCCRCRCSCGSPAQMAVPTVARSIPPQLLMPFPEPPVMRRPLPSAAASRGRPTEAPAAPTTGPDALRVLATGPGPIQVLTGGPGSLQAIDPGPLQVPVCPQLKRQPVAAMFQGGEEDDHPYVRILDTPAPERPLLARYLQPISFSAIGFGSAFVFNIFAKKPPFAGIQRHMALGAAGWMAGIYINKWIDSNSAERDAVLKHYIQLHPEDFPVPERKKYSELLQPWSPLR